MRTRPIRGVVGAVGGVLALLVPACREDVPAGANANAAATADPPAARLVFPDDLRVTDASVNEFVNHAMTVCGGGDYGAFRLLWSVREQPLTRDEFDTGWQAVQEIRVRGLEKVKLAAPADEPGRTPEVVYVLYAEVDLDPTLKAVRGKPQREVVLMIVREHDAWRVARTPKSMRAWMADKVKGLGGDTPDNGDQAAPPAESG